MRQIVEYSEKELETIKAIVQKVGRDVMSHAELKAAYQETSGKLAVPPFILKNMKLVYHKNEIRGQFYLPVLDYALFTVPASDSIISRRQEYMAQVVAPKEQTAEAIA